MAGFITSLVIFAILYFPLRLLKENWERLSLPPWCVIPAGVLAWGVVISLLGPPIAIIYACANVVAKPSIGAASEAIAVFFLTGIIANLVTVHREILDWDHMSTFLRFSLKFRNYFKEDEDLFVQLEKKEIRDIHRQTTGKELVEEAPLAKKELAHMDPEAARRMLERARSAPVASVHFEEEMRILRAGDPVDITDTFTVNSFKHPRHALYKDTHALRIDPVAKELSFAVHFVRITAESPLSSNLLFHVKQDLYDMLQALISEQWLGPYVQFFETLSITCYRVSVDSFDLPQQLPFMKIVIPVRELRSREGSFFSVADLHTIATISFVD